MPRVLLSRFESLIREHGTNAVGMAAMILDRDDRLFLRYIPFEHVNQNARLVLVGITPGPNQLDLAYGAAQRLLRTGKGQDVALSEIKRIAAFGGESMRPNLLRMLRHFRFGELLGVADEEELWAARADLLHSTSVVPHAAFWKDGRPFAGSFEDIRKSRVLRASFAQDFVPSLSRLRRDTLFVGLGPTPHDALKWCVIQGVLDKTQVVGAFAHPAATAGSQVAVYLRERSLENLSPRDPVRHRAGWLTTAYDEVAESIARLHGEVPLSVPPFERQAVAPALLVLPAATPGRDQAMQASVPTTSDLPAVGLRYVVKRGKGLGTILTPHQHEDGTYVVSPTRYEKDYVRVTTIEDVKSWAKEGYSVRMSNPASRSNRSPSLISPSSIEGL